MPRQGPPESATQVQVGTQRRGLDGNMWEIVKNKNGVRRWQRLAAPSRGTVELFDNRTISMKLVRAVAEDDIVPDLLGASEQWATYLRPVARDLLEHGILLLIYPMGYYFVDYAEEDLLTYIRVSSKLRRFFKIPDSVISERDFSDMFYEQNVIHVLYYLAVSSESITIALKHALSDETRKIVGTVLKKRGVNFKWPNWSASKAILVTKAGMRPKPRKSFVALLVDKLRKDVRVATGRPHRIRIVQHGRPREKENDPRAPTIIEFDIDVVLLRRLLKKYEIEEFVSYLKTSTPFDVPEDEYAIQGNKLFVYFVYGMSARTYDILTSS